MELDFSVFFLVTIRVGNVATSRLARICAFKVTRDSKASSILVPCTVRQDMGPMFSNVLTVQNQIVQSSMKVN